MTQLPGHQQDMRWHDYVLLRGDDFPAFWRDHCRDPHRKLSFVVGRGFDPRTTLGLRTIASLAGKCPIDLLALEYEETDSNPAQPLVDAAAANWSTLQSLIKNGKVASETDPNRSPKLRKRHFER
jgi:hypothetical protein